MPRSSSVSSSDSSHDSESHRKRSALMDEDTVMDIERALDSPVPPAGTCEHVQLLSGSTQMLSNYEKALKWSTSSLSNGIHSAKRRRVCQLQ